MSEVNLPRAVANRLLAHAMEGGDAEVCGLVAARDGVPSAVYPVRNESGEPARRFHMDPRGQIDAMRRMREAGEELFAIYHSHPAAPAIPSPADLAEAAYPDVLYLVISLGTRGLLEMRGFRLQGTTFVPVDLAIE